MNERLKELAEQAGLEEGCVHGDWTSLNWPDVRAEDLERFAQLVRDDERDKCASDYLQDCCDAVDAARLEEREACAKLCLELVQAKASGESYEDGTYDCAAAIRARSEPNPAFKNYMGDNWAGIV